MTMFEKVITFAISIILLVTTSSFGQWDTVYVDQSRSAGGDGQSWGTAFIELDTAICFNPDTNLVILCAEGIYYPDSDKGKFCRGGNKNFKLIGGYPSGCTNNTTSPQEVYRVVLSGDLQKNDSYDTVNNTFSINGTNAEVVLDLIDNCKSRLENLTIQGGDNRSGFGGGLRISDSANIIRCRFISNRALAGGAIYSDMNGDLYTFIDSCFFKDNKATDTTDRNGDHLDPLNGGGAILATDNFLSIKNSVFIKNYSENAGGAVCIHKSEEFISENNFFEACTSGSFGGAVYARILYVTVSKNIMINNTATRGGGAILSYNTTFNMDTTIFRNNHSGGHGGALILGSNGCLNNCQFLSNSADSSGGAMFVNSNTDTGIIIRGNIFESNKARFNGGALYIHSGPFTINQNSMFVGNRAYNNGGGLFLNNASGIFLKMNSITFESDSAKNGAVIFSEYYQDSTFAVNCFFKNNVADSLCAVSFQNGGLYRNCSFIGNKAGSDYIISGTSIFDPGPVLRECTFAENIVPAGKEILEKIPLIKNTIVWNNIGTQVGDSCDIVKYSLIKNWAGGGECNISSNPKFDTTEYTYQIKGGSPAINAGDPDTSGVDSTDLSGGIRIYGHRIDIGAYECHHGRLYVDKRSIGSNNGSTWGHAYKDLQDAISTAVSGDSIWVAKGEYKPDRESGNRNFCFTLPDSVFLIGGFAGNETEISQRNWLQNPVTLTGEINNQITAIDNSYSVVKTSPKSVIDGFRIIKGNDSGAVVILNAGNSIIRNCIISQNTATQGGAGIHVRNADNVLIEKCFIFDNEINGSVGTVAAGMRAYNCTDLQIRNNIFAGNIKTGYKYGASAASFVQCSLSIKNCTFSRNNNKSILLENSSATLVNDIIWNDSSDSDTLIYLNNSLLAIDYCDIRTGISGIKTAGTSSISGGENVFNLDPDFADALGDDVNLTRTSPCIDRGSNVDTIGWGFDLEGNSRIYNLTIDIGALEFQGAVTPEPPIILSTLNDFSIPANGTRTIALNQKKNDSTGYYVFYSFRDICELTWRCVSSDTNVTVTIDPGNNNLQVRVSPAYRPGDRFSIRLRTADPEFTGAAAEKNVQFTVINPGYRVCDLNISQIDTGRFFEGSISVENTIDPIYLSRERIYLGDTVCGSLQYMQYITGINLTETTLPASRGGSSDCGIYSFTFNPTEIRVYNATGLTTGKTLYEWATDSTSRYPGSIYYKNHKKIKFIFPVTNGLSNVEEFLREVSVDFDAPLTTLRISENSPHRHLISWESFKEPLSALALYIIPEGDSAPEPDTVIFDSSYLSRTEYIADSLQDSRTYQYILHAADKRGNTGESQVRVTTPSDLYTVSGHIQSVRIPFDTVISMKVYKLLPGKPNELLISRAVKLDTAFQLNRITNGTYLIELEKCGRYEPMPLQNIITISRNNVSGLHLYVSPEPVTKYDAVRIEQLENTGDLKISVKTNTLFTGEIPVRIGLHWEGGDSTLDTGSQEFTISSFNEIANSDGSAIWSFIISRAEIVDSILIRKNGFTDHVRYYNSTLSTSAFGYPTFRQASWEYPVVKGNRELLAPQWFVKPNKPIVSEPKMSCRDARFLIKNMSPGPGMKAMIKFEHAGGLQIIEKNYPMPNLSYPQNIDGKVMIVCPFDWNYTTRCKSDTLGRSFLSGYFIDSISADTSVARIGTGFTKYGGNWLPGDTADSVPFASWKIDVYETGNYWAWIYVDRKADTTTKVFISFGDINDGNKYAFAVRKNASGWIPVSFKNSSSIDRIYNLFEGKTDVNLFYPDNDISVSALALMKASGNRPYIRPEIRDSVPPWGGYLYKRMAGNFVLDSNSLYNMKVWICDRYGNTSDTVVFDSVHTLDKYYKGKISIHEEPVTGNLSFNLKQPVPGAEYLDSIIFRFNGNEYSLPFHERMNNIGQTEIKIPREKLSELINIDEFKRHALYDSLHFVFSSDTSYWVISERRYQCNPYWLSNCGKWEASWEHVGVFNATCIESIRNWVTDTIQTARIPLSWPDGTIYHVSSQEYRNVTDPVITCVDTTSRTVRFSCTNMNTTSSSGIKEQMSGQLRVVWTPGSYCNDSTLKSFPFGNRFTMYGNWIAFVPSFEGSINSSVGEWRHLGHLGTRHQWIDIYDGTRPTLGGEFFPNIGDSIEPVELYTNLSKVPSISTGIFLESDQASQNTTDTSELFHLWVLPSKVNRDYNSTFYWGIDGQPDTVTMGNVFSNDTSGICWRRGPSVYLTVGDHTIDLYMKSDGAGIAAIALSKDTAYPSLDLDSLSRWGDHGFAVDIHATELPSNNDITFSWQAIDRFGNVSDTQKQVIRTREFDEPIPNVVISPDVPLENGYYHSIYPSFTMSLSNAVPDSLVLETVLMYNDGSLSDSISRLNVTLVDTSAHIWNVSVDSSYALSPFPDSGGITSTNGYAIRARIRKSNGNIGDWTQLLFGVKADTSEIPSSVVIRDTLYEPSALSFKFLRGIEVASNRIIGDLEIQFDFENSSGKKLVLEGAIIYTDTTFDSGSVVHERIDSIYGGKIACYECDEYSYNCSRSSVFSFPYGKYTVETFAESLTVQQYGSVKKIRSPITGIHDDNGSYVRLSSNRIGHAVPFTRYGIIDTCYSYTDRFFLKNVLSFSNIYDGFHIDACDVVFARDTTTRTYSLLTSGMCVGCGPDLNFTVLSPRYLDEEFTVFDKLDSSLRITYVDTAQKYEIDFGPVGSNYVSQSNSSDIQYCGWDLKFKSYAFNVNGIVLTDFSVGLHDETFPAEKNGGNKFVNQFTGTKITGLSSINEGALHLSGSASAPGVMMTSSNDYVFREIDTIKFVPENSYDYKIRIPEICSLAVPSYKNEDFNESETLKIEVAADSGFILGPDGVEKVQASGIFVRSIGNRNSTNIFTINGILDVSYAARDFQLQVRPNGTDPIFLIDDAFFHSPSGPVSVSKGSIGFFSDFTINTLYGKKDDGVQYTVSPEQFGILKIPSQGFDIFKTSSSSTAGIRILLLAPNFNVGNISSLLNESADNSCSLESSIYNAGFDLNGNLTNLSGKIELPEDIMSCLGVNGMEQISQNIASFKLKTLYLGYENDSGEVFKLGADASITLGSLFNKIGLEGEKISLSKLTAEYSNGDWSLAEMHASAFPLPRLIGIGPKNYSKIEDSEYGGDSAQLLDIRKDWLSGVNYLELYTGGNGFKIDYEKGKNLKLDLRNWSLRLTNNFPFKQLRGVSFFLNEFVYEKDLTKDSDGRVTALKAGGEYVPPGGSLKFGDVEFYRARISLGYDKESDSVDNANKTSVNAYLAVAFDSLRVGEKTFVMTNGTDCKTNFRIYFDGQVQVNGCLLWTDTIGIVPWGQEHNPDIYIDPGITGTEVSFSIDTRSGFSARLRNVYLRSKKVIPALDTKLAVDVNELSIQLKDKKFCLKKLDASWWIYKKLIDNTAFKMVINKIDFGYAQGRKEWVDSSTNNKTDLKDAFWIITQPEIDFKLSKHCDVDIKPEIGLVIKTDRSAQEQKETKFIWKVNGDFDCEVGSLDFGGKFKLNEDTIGFDHAFLNLNRLEESGMFNKNDKKDKFKNLDLGVDFYNVFWVKKGGDWHFNKDGKIIDSVHHDKFSVVPRFNFEKEFDICGLLVNGKFNFERLFTQPYPGIGYENISVSSKKLGNQKIPLFMSLYLDGRKPFLHPEFDGPKKIPIAIPAIALTPDIALSEAYMEFGVEQVPGKDEEKWYFMGRAGMNLKGAVENLTVSVSFEKPSPWENVTGINYAKVKLKLAEKCRIPIGSTPLFISGFEGALYDGNTMPDGAKACYIPTLPPGLKVEAAIFVELQDPALLNGRVGFWVHLMKLNFGVNGSVEALRGIADADACMALYNNGQAFHGHFRVMIHMGLMSKGQFVIDIWKDETGGNFTADASAQIGLQRGGLIKRRFIKIPRKDRWFIELFTNAGKFSNQQNGITTGLRFFGRTWGLGVIGGSFKIGNMGQYKLKQAPIVLSSFRTSALAKSSINSLATNPPETEPSFTIFNPGFKLEGGEVISFTAATDSSSFAWPENVLRVVDPETMEFDSDEQDYIPFEGRGEDNKREYFIHDENMVARLWVNNKNYDSIYLVIPDTARYLSGSHGAFEYTFFAGLKPPRIDSITAQADDTNNTKQVVFNGTISDFQGHIRNIVRTDAGGVDDTLLKQKMNLKLYCSTINPGPADTALSSNYLYNFLQIPFAEFDGYDTTHSSLLDNPHVSYDSSNRTLNLTNLVWNTTKMVPGEYALRAAVEVTDFVVEDEDGIKTILPLNREDDASVFRYDPVAISTIGSKDTILINIVNDLPFTRPAGFTATGSEADTNWAGENEKRSIFLRWHMDNNPAIHGYQIAWYPTGSDSVQQKRKRLTYIGKTDHYTITIPDLTANDSLYTEDCDSARGSAYLTGDTVIDSTQYVIHTDSAHADSQLITFKINEDNDTLIDTIYYGHVTEFDTTFIPDSSIVTRPNRLCPDMIDTAYYKARAFDVILTPVYNTVITHNDTTYGPGRPQSIVKANINSEYADTIGNVRLGINRGESNNKFRIQMKTDSTVYHGDTIEVSLNAAKVINTNIFIKDKNLSDDESRYGELWASVENNSVLPIAMPQAGAFDNYFTVNNDTFKTAVSIRPVEKNMSCKEMFGSTCYKIKVDSNGVISDTNPCQSCTTGCESFAADGNQDCKLNASDPCNGSPDTLLIQRTPFSTFKMYLYAVNNGQRRKPVRDTAYGPVVYDSLWFKVVPPSPVLHGVSPSYVLNNHEDSLSLAVSGLWLDSAASLLPGVKFRWYSKDGVENNSVVDLTRNGSVLRPMITGESQRDWKLETNAEWEVKVSTQGLFIDTTGETRFYVSLINRDIDTHGDSVKSYSNEVTVDYIYNPGEIECPDSYYDLDGPNSAYLMDWIGNYPSDFLSPGDSVFVRFTELHDLNPAHYTVKLLKNNGASDDTLPINSFKIDYSGISLKLPDNLEITEIKKFRIVTSLVNSLKVPNCYDKNWGSDLNNAFSTIPARKYRIMKVGNGFRIVAVEGSAHRDKDMIRYAIGKIPFTQELLTYGYDHLSDPPQLVEMTQSNWVTAVIKRKSGPQYTIEEWIDVENIPQLFDVNGIPVSENFETEPGETFYIRSPELAFYDQSQTKPYHSYRFADGDSVIGDAITMKADSRGPLTIYRWSETSPGTGTLKRQLEGFKSYNFTLKTYTGKEIASIVIPSQRLLNAASAEVPDYPLLLRLDSTVISGIDTLLSTKNFHFRDAAMQLLSFEIESIDTIRHTADIWVKMPVNPGIGNNIVHLVSGAKSNNPHNVWTDYKAVWHSNGDSVLYDATGNGFSVPATGSAVIIPGLVDYSIRLSGQLSSNHSGEYLIGENDPGVTISAWIKIYNFPSTVKPIVSLINTKNSVAGFIAVTPDSGLFLIMGNDTLKTIRGALEDSIWLNITVTYDWYNSNGSSVVYVNGLPVARRAGMNSGDRIGNITHLQIRCSGINMMIDELRVAPAPFYHNRISLDYFSQRQRGDFLKAPTNVTSVTSVSASEYRMVPRAEVGDLVCTNKNWRLATIKPDLEGKTWLLMPWEDRFSTEDTLVTIHLNGAANLYLLLDSRYSPKPPFLNSWTETGRSVGVEGPFGERRLLSIYSLEIDSAANISFGGPQAGGAQGGDLPWAVLMDCSQDKSGFKVSAQSYPFVKVTKAESGELLFSDREHEIDSLPETLQNGVLVQTSNAFRFSDSSSFVSFSVNRPAIASILVDTAYRSWPSFILDDNTWKACTLRITSGNKVLSVLQKKINTGESMNVLGGPQLGGGNGNRFSYAMLLQPDNTTDIVRIIFPQDCHISQVDTGKILFSDLSYHQKEIPEDLRKKILLSVDNQNYDCTDSVNLKIELLRSAWVYYAVDDNQSVPPLFLTMSDNNGGRWELTTLSIGLSNGARFRIYRKFLTDGVYSFPCARYDGSDDNNYNPFVIVDTSRTKPHDNSEIPGIDTSEIRIADTNQDIYKDIPGAIIEFIPVQIKGLPFVMDSGVIDYCRNRSITFEQPVRIWLGVDPAFRTTGTFLEYNGWEKTGLIISISGLQDRTVWCKTFDPGVVTIPGVHCDYKQPGVMNHIIFIEYLEAPSTGLYGRNLKVTGFGDERFAQTDNYIVKNLDVVYSYEIGMSSRSWVMNVETRSAVAEPDDTIKVLTPFGNDTICRINDTTIIRVENQFYLAELMPVLVAADSVQVNAIDLRAQGYVRVAFRNSSPISVNTQFVVILFEDRNGDFVYNSYDKRLGSITVNGIGAGETKLYQISIDDTLSFPNRTLFSFIDATEQIDEMNEWNNFGSSGTTCENYTRPVFVEEIDDRDSLGKWGHKDSITTGLPVYRDSTIFCYLQDFNGDSIINSDDTLCILYTYDNRLYAVNAITHDSLFTSLFAGLDAVAKIRVDDYNDDGKPEITAGNILYRCDGVLLHDFTAYTPLPGIPAHLSDFDFNRDGERDNIIPDSVDSCITVRSGRDSTLLFVSPISNWHGSIDVTVPVLADIHQGQFNCYDINVSFPRFSATLSDTVDLTIRVANAGAATVHKVQVEMFADTIDRDSSYGDGLAELPTDVTCIGQSRTSTLGSNVFMDFQIQAVLPNNVKRVWFRVDGENGYHECRENDNVIGMRVR